MSLTREELEALLVEEQQARSEWARRALAAEREVETLRRDLALARQGLRVVDAVAAAEPPVEVGVWHEVSPEEAPRIISQERVTYLVDVSGLRVPRKGS